MYAVYSIVRSGSEVFGQVFKTPDTWRDARVWQKFFKDTLGFGSGVCIQKIKSVEAFKSHPSFKEVRWL